jgi:hypothetical protein
MECEQKTEKLWTEEVGKIVSNRLCAGLSSVATQT